MTTASDNVFSSQQSTVTVETIFDVPLEFAWLRLGRFSSIVDWQDSVAECFIEERPDGVYRVVVMSNNSAFVERLESFSHVTHEFSYSIKSGPVPVRDYLCQLQLFDAGAGRTRLVWSALFEVLPSHGAMDIENQLRNLFNNGLMGMHRLLSASSSNAGVRT